MAYVLAVDGTKTDVAPVDGNRFTFAEVYKLIDAVTIQLVKTHEAGVIMLLDEDGKLKHKPINPFATKLYVYGAHDAIVGTAFVCKRTEMR